MVGRKRNLAEPNGYGKRLKTLEKILGKENAPTAAERRNFGILKSISVVNFMCHKNLCLGLEDIGNVNFVVGHNGSGKSALLTALIVGLGGKSVSTGRGTTLKTFIRTGCKYAKIQVVLRNDGEEMFSDDQYGEEIIVERTIKIDGSSSYKLKNADNKLISTKKEDLTSLLENLNLDVDNPLTCLNQELSKNFLHSKSESDKYQFFLKSTQLEQLNKDYKYIKAKKLILRDEILARNRELLGLGKIVREKVELFEKLDSLRELGVIQNRLRSELAWSHVKRIEQELRPSERDLELELVRVSKFAESSEKYARREENANDEIERIESLIRELMVEKDSLPNKNAVFQKAQEVENQYRDSDRRYLSLSRKYNEGKIQLTTTKDRVAKLKREETDNRDLLEYNRQMVELEKLKSSAKDLHAKLENIDNEINELNSDLVPVTDEHERLKRDYRDNMKRSDHIKQRLESLKAEDQTSNNKLTLYGEEIPQLITKINAAYQIRQFKQRPRGPIGSYLSVCDPQLAVPVEGAVRKYLKSFVVDNAADERRLSRLMDSCILPNKRASYCIYTMKFLTRRHDVRKAQHHKHKTVLDLLKISDPDDVNGAVIANCLIDLAGIETQLVIPETAEAVHVMQGKDRPRNCTRAYTKNGDEVFSDRFYSNQRAPVVHYLGANCYEKIKLKTEECKNLFKANQEICRRLSVMNEKRELIETRICSKRDEMLSLKRELNHVQTEIRKLQMLEKPVFLDWKEVEDEARNLESKLADLLQAKNNAQVDVENIERIMKEEKPTWKSISAKETEISLRVGTLRSEQYGAIANLRRFRENHEFYKTSKQKSDERVKVLQNDVDELRQLVAEVSRKAEKVCIERVETNRSPQSIQQELQNVKHRMKEEEKLYGNRDDIIKEAYYARKRYTRIQNELQDCERFYTQVCEYLDKRQGSFENMRECLAMHCVVDFDLLLKQKNFVGDLIFNHEEKTIKIMVSPKNDRVGMMRNGSEDVRTLSGGERTFSTVCFILSLWQVMQSPLRCLDEFDVFMDMATRRVALDMLVDMALLKSKVQFLFMTPHDISSLTTSNQIHVYRMADPKQADAAVPAIADDDDDENRPGTSKRS